LKLLLAASEVVGFAKTGGLADVAGALPRALARRGHECAVMMPLYRSCRLGRIPPTSTPHRFTIHVGGQAIDGSLWQARLPGCEVPVYLISQPAFFERDDPAQGHSLYQFTLPSGQKRDYSDNCERFTFFSRAVLEAIQLLDFWPDLLHLNDWQTGLVAPLLKEEYGQRGEEGHGPRYRSIRTVFTVHNLAYQGLFPYHHFLSTGLGHYLFNYRQLEFYGQLSLLKAGLVFADAISTVSPTYAREIQTAEFGCGLQGVLQERRDRLFGIVNGVDYEMWDPATDSHLVVNYGVSTVTKKKPLCKAALQRRHGLREEPRAPLLGMIARLVDQKGINLVLQVAESLMTEGAQLVVLGEGDAGYHRALLNLRGRFPDRVGVTLALDEVLAHQIEAGADMFLMPSLFEPCGLNQMYSLKYGTVPVVRATGGLADTVVDCTPETLSNGTATGFGFGPAHADAFWHALERALGLYRDEPEKWRQLIDTGMRQDWSWNRSAADYEALYRTII
jgi:starch synthase